MNLCYNKHNTLWGVANGTQKIQGLGKFRSNLEISEDFVMSLEFSFFWIFLGLGVSNFWPQGLGVSDFILFQPESRTKRIVVNEESPCSRACMLDFTNSTRSFEEKTTF